MGNLDFSKKTVIELRQIAREYGVTLGAGLNKAAIIEKLDAALGDNDSLDQLETDEPSDASEQMRMETEEEPEAAPAEPAQPQFRAAWHNPSNRLMSMNPRVNGAQSRPANGFVQRSPRFVSSAQEAARPATPQPKPGFANRFGPASAHPEEAAEQPAPAARGFGPAAYRQAAPAETAASQPAPVRQAPEERPAWTQLREAQPSPAVQQQDTLTAAEMMAAPDVMDAMGIFDPHPDGYGFIRGDNLQPSSRDIYVAAPLIRRYHLRSGDQIRGKVRPRREADRYAALLYPTEINGQPADENDTRPNFENLTAVFASRRISLGNTSEPLRVLDVCVSLGFGQRVLMLTPPECGKVDLLLALENGILSAYPETSVMSLLIDQNAEDVTVYRERAKGRVAAATFDQTPEAQMRLADLVIERMLRLAELGKDAVLLVDSLSRLSRLPSAQATGRAAPGTLSPAGLARARKLFGSARNLREGGSLTVMGCMLPDDPSLEDFRGAATAIITLDRDLCKTGIFPPLYVSRCGMRKPELLLSKEEITVRRQLKSSLPADPEASLRALSTLAERAKDMEELLSRWQDWLPKDAR